jgi:hypothetical protein
LVTKFEAKSFYNTLLDIFAMKTTVVVALVIAGMLAATAIFAQQMTSPAFAASSASAGSASSTSGTAAANADTGAGTITDSAAGGAAGGTQSAGGDTALCPHSSAGGTLFFGGACTGTP